MRVESAIDDHFNGNTRAAFEKLLELASHNCADAYVFLGNFYEAGEDDIRDYSQAMRYYTMAIDTCGSIEAYLGKGRLQYYGLGVKRDYCSAFDLFVKASEASNNPIADLMLGTMFQEGECVDQDYEMAKKYYLSAWEKGNVFGLTKIANIEKIKGNYISSLHHRIKAGYTAFRIALKDPEDKRLRQP